MEHDRADVIVGGAIVLLSVMEVLGFDDLTVSEADILDGIVAQLLEG
jgi:exopolyphosphatase/pppGpp-phosphohydrolase